MNMTSATSNDPIFLVGAERSGSTLLRLVLSHHSRIAWLNEFEYSVDMIDSPDHWPDADPYHEWLRTHRIFQASGLRCEGDTYPEIVRGFLSQFAQRSGRPIVGATVHRNFDRLLRLWPDARFIHILRDPRDVARSCIGMGWAGNVYAGARLWIDAEQTWGRLIDQADPSRRIEVRYEDLVRDPDRALRPVCAFLGVDYEPGMLEIGATTTYERPDPSVPEPAGGDEDRGRGRRGRGGGGGAALSAEPRQADREPRLRAERPAASPSELAAPRAVECS